MKRIIILLIISLTVLLPQALKASHYMGGEITWKCVNSGPDTGKYIFYLRVYRECGGITFGGFQTLSSNSPAGNISMSLVTGYPVDISPTCNSNFTQITCAAAELTGADNTGAVSEYLYESAPLSLSGVPPASGWIFSWGSCCRNPSDNLIGQASWKLRAIMYHYNNTNTSTCFDNSPQFANKAKSVLISNYGYSFNHATYDTDLDSLHFEWGQPLQSLTSPVTYAPGYSYTSPLPDVTENSSNIGATINPQTGVISFLSYTTGAFLTNIKISSYRNNQLIAEVWREIQIVILAGGSNTPPTLGVTLNNQILEDTVYAGDTVSLTIGATDAGFHPNGSPQLISLNANGQQFGNYISTSSSNLPSFDPQNGCQNTPCATLTPAPNTNTNTPLTGTFAIQTSFNWVTDCNHLENRTDGTQLAKTHYFNFEIADDFCPVPSQSNFTYAVTVLPNYSNALSTNIKSISTSDNGDINFKWSPVVDLNNSFISYNLYQQNLLNGTYLLIDSITNINISSYTYNTGQTPIMKNYKLETIQSNCANYISSNTSTITKNIVLNSTNIGNCITKLSWNNTNHSNTYFIVKRKTNGIWTTLDSILPANYTDTADISNAEYMIETPEVTYIDSLGNTIITKSNSNIKHEQTPLNIGADTTLCKDGSLLLNIANGFDSYLWYNGISNNWLLIHASDLTIGDNNIWLKANMNYGCEITDTLVLTIEDCNTSINENNDKLSFEIFPNPSSGKFTLDIKSMETQDLLIEVISIDGKIIYSKNTKITSSETSINMDISDQAAGSYILRISNENYKSQKAIKLI